MKLQEQHKMLTRDPDKIIAFINELYPEVKGLCFKGDGILESKNYNKADFYFDPFHNVLEVTIY